MARKKLICIFRWNEWLRCSILSYLIFACWDGVRLRVGSRLYLVLLEMKNVLLGGSLLKILFVNGTIIGTKTGIMLNTVRDYIEETKCGFELEILNLADFEHQIVDGRPFEKYNVGHATTC